MPSKGPSLARMLVYLSVSSPHSSHGTWGVRKCAAAAAHPPRPPVPRPPPPLSSPHEIFRRRRKPCDVSKRRWENAEGIDDRGSQLAGGRWRFLEELEGNGPIDSRAKVISDSKLGLKFEIRILNYPVNYVHVAETSSLISSNGKQTADGEQTADIKINS